MQKIAHQLDERSLPTGRWAAAACLKGEALQDSSTSTSTAGPLERLNRRFATVATDLNSGSASSSAPAIPAWRCAPRQPSPAYFQPTQFRGHSYVDGSLTSPVPVQAAREMGADIVIAVDISAKPEGQPNRQHDRHHVADDDHHGRRHRGNELKGADVVIRPRLPLCQVVGFHRPQRCHARRGAAPRRRWYGDQAENGALVSRREN